jgi:methylthioribose-1-phosphate isomerase
MKIFGRAWRTIWPVEDGCPFAIIDQTKLPFLLETPVLRHVDEMAHAIRSMQVRGAPLIGAAAAAGVALAMRTDSSDAALGDALALLGQTRPTAVNLRWALERMARRLEPLPAERRAGAAHDEALAIADEDVALCEAIGTHGHALLRARAEELGKGSPGRPLEILTHCNAGWLATVDWGTALAPIYKAHDAGLILHVWVDETRPRNQGAALTAFELKAHGVPHTIIADNAGGHLMQRGKIDLVIVGTDRTAANGDVANKIGTYLKALAAHDNDVPFLVALPSPTIDWSLADGFAIPIEERSPREVTHMAGRDAEGRMAEFEIANPGSAAANPAFDVTPARLVAGLITERGVCKASREGLEGLFPERAAQ